MGSAGVYVNSRVRNRAASYFKYNQDPVSKLARFMPDVCNNTGNFAETGDTLIALGFLGWTQYDTNDTTLITNDYAGSPITRGEARRIFNDYLGAVANRWVSFQVDCDPWVSGLFYNDGGSNATPYLRTDRMGNIHAIFGFAEALGSLPNGDSFRVLNGHNWKREFSTYLVRNQAADGTWMDARWAGFPNATLIGVDYYGVLLTTAYGALTLAPNPLLDHPVALGSALVEDCGDTVRFSHAESFHFDPWRRIVDYQWLFDSPSACFDCVDWSAIPNNGYSADGGAWHGSNPNASVSHTYPQAGTYHPALRVVDDGNPAKSGIFQTSVTAHSSQNMPPVADAGGPYLVALGNGLALNGSATDASPCGDVLSYAWELDNDGLFDDAVGTAPALSATQLQALGLAVGSHVVRLKVTDSFGATGTASTTLTLSGGSSTTTVSCPASVEYSGAAQTPCTATATGTGGLSQILTVAYLNNIDAGTATASASFAGDASHGGSSDSKTFAIEKAASATTVSCPATPVIYTGSPLAMCSAAVTGVGGLQQALPVSYANNIIGTARATASFAGDANHYGSSGAGTFRIVYPQSAMCLGEPGHQILQPINAEGTSVFKQKSTVAAKFRVCDATGRSVGTPGVVRSFNLVGSGAGTGVQVEEVVLSTTPDTAFRWDPSAQHWIFNMSTKHLAANQTYLYRITLNDESVIEFRFGLR